MSGLNVNYKPKSITGLLMAAGILFVGTGSVFENGDLTQYGNLFLLLGVCSWVYHIDKYKKKSTKRPTRRPPVGRYRA